MKSKIKQAVLKLMLLQEEFTENELKEAINYINDNKKSPLNNLFNKVPGSNIKKDRSPSKSFDEQESKVIQDIKNSEPEKYRVLSDFDSLIRKGAILTSHDEIKTLASKLSKEFPKTRSRKESVPKLMALFVKLEISNIKSLIEEIIKTSNSSNNESEYQRLAQFIIQGE